VETELAKKRGKMVDVGHKEEMDHVDELYTVPDHLKVCLWLNEFLNLRTVHCSVHCDYGTVILFLAGEEEELRGELDTMDHWHC
jgi:hypothetical protein